MLQVRLLLFSGTAFLLQKSVVAFLRMEARQLDNIWNFDGWGKTGADILTGIGALGTELNLQLFGQEDTTTTTESKDKTVPGAAPPGPLNSDPNEPDYQLETQPEIPKGGPREPSVPSSPCDTTNIFSIDCGKVLDQLIFTTSCKTIAKAQVPTAIDIAQNGAILDELNTMAPGRVRTCKLSQCDVFMFTAPLTSEQSRQISEMPGVSHVSSNIYFDAKDGSMKQPQPDPAGIEPASKRRKLRKRDTVRQANAPPHLQFLSTPENYRGISTDYVYDSTGGADTVVFLIGHGLTMTHDEFNNRITYDDFIFANDVPTTSTLESRSFGTCIASLVGGQKYGVSKNTKLKPVRTQADVGSLISAMTQIGNYIQARKSLGQPASGYVMVMDMEWEDADQQTTQNFERMLSFLLYELDVVTVVGSGHDYDEQNGPIYTYPALYGADTPVITVGAVDISGELISWSRVGTGLTLTAPGIAVCASNEGGSETVTGGALAAAQVGGLAAYFLTRYPQLRADQNPQGGAAHEVKKFMTNYAYARIPGGEISIWNLMGPDTTENGIGGNSPY